MFTSRVATKKQSYLESNALRYYNEIVTVIARATLPGYAVPGKVGKMLTDLPQNEFRRRKLLGVRGHACPGNL